MKGAGRRRGRGCKTSELGREGEGEVEVHIGSEVLCKECGIVNLLIAFGAVLIFWQ